MRNIRTLVFALLSALALSATVTVEARADARVGGHFVGGRGPHHRGGHEVGGHRPFHPLRALLRHL